MKPLRIKKREPAEVRPTSLLMHPSTSAETKENVITPSALPSPPALTGDVTGRCGRPRLPEKSVPSHSTSPPPSALGALPSKLAPIPPALPPPPPSRRSTSPTTGGAVKFASDLDNAAVEAYLEYLTRPHTSWGSATRHVARVWGRIEERRQSVFVRSLASSRRTSFASTMPSGPNMDALEMSMASSVASAPAGFPRSASNRSKSQVGTLRKGRVAHGRPPTSTTPSLADSLMLVTRSPSAIEGHDANLSSCVGSCAGVTSSSSSSVGRGGRLLRGAALTAPQRPQQRSASAAVPAASNGLNLVIGGTQLQTGSTHLSLEYTISSTAMCRTASRDNRTRSGGSGAEGPLKEEEGSTIMSTERVPKDAVTLLQQYAIDLKDFTKAKARYTAVLKHELVAPPEEEDNTDVVAATRTAQDLLRAAWQAYVASVQHYFHRIVRELVDALLEANGSGTYAAAAAAECGDDPLSGASVKKNVGANGSSLFSETHISSADSRIFSLALSSASIPAIGSGNSSSVVSLGGVRDEVSLRVERLNEFCTVCEKWYIHNEMTFELPKPEALAAIAGSAIASVSRLLRLLGMRMVYVCAGCSIFLRSFVRDEEAVRWAAFCGDRGLPAEVDALLCLMDRMMQLWEVDKKAYPPLPFGWLYRLTSFLEHPDSVTSASPKRRGTAVRLALQLLRQRPDQATAAGVHIVLLNACIESNHCVTPGEAQQVIHTLLNLFDAPSTRQYIHTSDIRILFAPFLSTTSVEGASLLTMQNKAKDLIVTVLCTWVGNLWISSEVTGLRSLIDVLHLPGSLDTKMVVITLFNKLLTRLAPHRGIVLLDTWKGFEDDRQRKATRDTLGDGGMPEDDADALAEPLHTNGANLLGDLLLGESIGDMALFDDFIPTTKALGYHVMDPLMGRVLMCLNYHGLPYALTQILQTTNKNRVITAAASNLLQDIFVLMDTVLPKVIVFHLHEAFNKAVGRLANDGSLFVGGLTSQLFRSYKKNCGVGGDDGGGGALAVESVAPTNTSHIPNAALNTSGTLDVDDSTFATLLRDAKIDRMKSWQTWGLDSLATLVQGPLHRSRRFHAARDVLEALILFFTPTSQESTPQMRSTFSTLPTDTTSPQVCMLGIELIDLLLSTREGAALLDQAGFVAAVAVMLKEVRVGKPLVLCRPVVNTRIGQTLLRMTGRLSAHANGLLLMRDHSIFSLVDSMFSKLRGPRLESTTEEDTLQDVCYQLLQYLYLGAVPNYGVCDEIRRTFRAALSNPSNTIRLCAAQQLKKAVWRDLSTSMKWGIETLLVALHDHFFSVIESAFKLLQSICLCSDEGLDFLIECFPTVLMESEVILSHAKQLRLDVLLYRIASRPSGFRFLQNYGWVDKELLRWEETESVRYTIMLERLQAGGGSTEAAASSACDGYLGGGSMFSSCLSDPSRRHTRSQSDMLNNAYGRMQDHTSYLPLLTAAAASGANFFPVHFAAILCSSVEGCAMFKHSRLWTRSVQRLLEQPLPPDIVYDVSMSDEEESTSEDSSDDEFGVTTDAARYMRQRQRQQQHSVTHHHHQQQQQQQRFGLSTGHGGSSVGFGGMGSHVGDTAATGINTFGNSANLHRYGGHGDHMGTSMNGALRARDALRGGGTAVSFGAGSGLSGKAAAAAGYGGIGGGAGGYGGLGGGSRETEMSASKEVEMLKKGYLTAPSTKMISAARFYKSSALSFSLECAGDIVSLKEAILCIAEVGSTDIGYGLLLSVPGLQRRFTALSRFSSTISVRCMGLLGSALLARSRRGGEDLVKKGYAVLLNHNAYVSAEGIPYAVSVAQMKPSKWVPIARKIAMNNSAARHAHAEGMMLTGIQDIPRRVVENIYALCNPVSSEGSKKVLYKMMKRQPQLFLQPNVRRLCLEAAYTYRMHHKERRFLADLLENAQLPIGESTSPKPSRTSTSKGF